MTVSITVPEVEPFKVFAGNTWTWKKSLTDYLPSNNWQLTYALVKKGVLIEIVATDDSDDHLVEVAAATTAAYDAGVYDYQANVSQYDDLEAAEPTLLKCYTIKTGKIEVLPAFSAQSSGYDARSVAKQNLDALEAILPDILGNKAASYSIAGRSMAFRTLDEWQNAYNFWNRRFATEERRAGRRASNIIRVHLK